MSFLEIKNLLMKFHKNQMWLLGLMRSYSSTEHKI